MSDPRYHVGQRRPTVPLDLTNLSYQHEAGIYIPLNPEFPPDTPEDIKMKWHELDVPPIDLEVNAKLNDEFVQGRAADAGATTPSVMALMSARAGKTTGQISPHRSSATNTTVAQARTSQKN